MNQYNQILKLLETKYGWNLTDSLTSQGQKLVRDVLLAQTEIDVKYGDYVQMDDRFESVHIWSKELETKNAGRWTPYKITKEKYEQEKSFGWNNIISKIKKF